MAVSTKAGVAVPVAARADGASYTSRIQIRSQVLTLSSHLDGDGFLSTAGASNEK